MKYELTKKTITKDDKTIKDTSHLKVKLSYEDKGTFKAYTLEPKDKLMQDVITTNEIDLKLPTNYAHVFLKEKLVSQIFKILDIKKGNFFDYEFNVAIPYATLNVVLNKNKLKNNKIVVFNLFCIAFITKNKDLLKAELATLNDEPTLNNELEDEDKTETETVDNDIDDEADEDIEDDETVDDELDEVDNDMEDENDIDEDIKDEVDNDIENEDVEDSELEDKEPENKYADEEDEDIEDNHIKNDKALEDEEDETTKDTTDETLKKQKVIHKINDVSNDVYLKALSQKINDLISEGFSFSHKTTLKASTFFSLYDVHFLVNHQIIIQLKNTKTPIFTPILCTLNAENVKENISIYTKLILDVLSKNYKVNDDSYYESLNNPLANQDVIKAQYFSQLTQTYHTYFISFLNIIDDFLVDIDALNYHDYDLRTKIGHIIYHLWTFLDNWFVIYHFKPHGTLNSTSINLRPDDFDDLKRKYSNLIVDLMPISTINNVSLDLAPYIDSSTSTLDFSTLKMDEITLKQTFLKKQMNNSHFNFDILREYGFFFIWASQFNFALCNNQDVEHWLYGKNYDSINFSVSKPNLVHLVSIHSNFIYDLITKYSKTNDNNLSFISHIITLDEIKVSYSTKHTVEYLKLNDDLFSVITYHLNYHDTIYDLLIKEVF